MLLVDHSVLLCLLVVLILVVVLLLIFSGSTNSAGACGAIKANDGATLISVNTTYSNNIADAILYGSKNAIGGAISFKFGKT